MHPSIGIVSPKAPTLKKDKPSVWFYEIEGLYAYLLYQSLNEIIFDKSLLEDEKFNKYLELIKQMWPGLKIHFESFLDNVHDENNKILPYPKLEVLFKQGLLKSLYQPIVKAQGDKVSIIGVECLSRLCYKENDYPPEILFSYAQEKLKVKDYDQICIWQALRNVPLKDGLIFLNVRPPTILDNNFIYWLKNILKEFQIKPENIVLEITEQYCVFFVSELNFKISSLRKEGFKIAIDDFGVGMSNFNLLLDLAPDFLKICGLLVKGISKDEKRTAIVESLLILAKRLKIITIVESVENKEDWHRLIKLGACFAQGYYFFKPKERDSFS